MLGKHRRRTVAGLALLVVATTTPLTADATAAPTGSAFTASKTVTRINYDNGADVPIDSRTVKVTVSATKGLRERQGIEVTWTGAQCRMNSGNRVPRV